MKVDHKVHGPNSINYFWPGQIYAVINEKRIEEIFKEYVTIAEPYDPLSSLQSESSKSRAKKISTMCFAAQSGDLNSVLKGLSEGLPIDAVDFEAKTLLNLASCEGHVHLVQELLIRKANLHAVDRWGLNPLENAVQNNRSQVANFLFINGAKLSHNFLEERLFPAVNNGDLEKVKILLENSSEESVNLADYDGKTPILIAAMKGHQELVTYLIQRGANLNVVDRFGETPLKEALHHHHDDIVKTLQEQGMKDSTQLEELKKLRTVTLLSSSIHNLLSPTPSRMNSSSYLINK